MNWNEYTALFDQILSKEKTEAPYDNEAYYNYVQLNQARSNRWMKKNPIETSVLEVLASINAPQQWILITEPWCGDAAHSAPIIKLMADASPNIDLTIELRDSGDLIDSYLTNGGKSIPKLIARDTEGNDLFVWGPRPKSAQELFRTMKERAVSYDESNQALQQWYNKNKSAEIQEEIAGLITASLS